MKYELNEIFDNMFKKYLDEKYNPYWRYYLGHKIDNSSPYGRIGERQ